MPHPPAFFQYDFQQAAGFLKGQNGWSDGFVAPAADVPTTATEGQFYAGTEHGAQINDALAGLNLDAPWFCHTQWRYTPRPGAVDPWYVIIGDPSVDGSYCYFGANAGNGTPQANWVIRDPAVNEINTPLSPRAAGVWSDILFRFTGAQFEIEYAGGIVASLPWAVPLGITHKAVGLYQQPQTPVPGDLLWEIRHLAVGAL